MMKQNVLAVVDKICIKICSHDSWSYMNRGFVQACWIYGEGWTAIVLFGGKHYFILGQQILARPIPEWNVFVTSGSQTLGIVR